MSSHRGALRLSLRLEQPEQLKCSKCGKFKPDEDFNQCSSATIRRCRAYWCRDCYVAYNASKKQATKMMTKQTLVIKRKRKSPQKNISPKPPQTLVCTKCSKTQPITNFSKSKKAKTRQGYAYWCKSCCKTHNAQSKKTQTHVLPQPILLKKNDSKAIAEKKQNKSTPQPQKIKKPKKLFCTKCGQRKPDSAFHVSNSAKLRRKRTYWCKDCSANYRATKVSVTTTPSKQQTQKPMEPMHYVSAIRQPYCPDHLL
jgi:Pyruvate/2-oxoacid:ferredoxin oxidoreductase delta subunit